MNNTVYLDRHADYELEGLLKLFEKRFADLDIASRIKPGMTVVIKPNLVTRSNPDSGIITHPNVVAAVGILVKRLGAKVLIAESSGGPFNEQAVKIIMNGCGYTAIAEKYGFDIYTECKFSEIELPDGKICKNINIVDPFINADFIINIAKFKSHCMTMLSGATKNLFGTVPGLMKPELHFRYPEKNNFSSMLIDLAQKIRPQLSIIDGIDGMEGDGPTGGVKCHIGGVITAESCYSADVVAAEIMGVRAMDIPMLKEANSRGLCVSSGNELNVVGDSIASCVKHDFRMPRTKDVDFGRRFPKFLQPLVKKITTPKPVIKIKDCVGCGKCAESCPQHTIVIKDRKAVIDYKNCINCFCCHEMCPVHVIDIKRFGAFRF